MSSHIKAFLLIKNILIPYGKVRLLSGCIHSKLSAERNRYLDPFNTNKV